MSTTQEVAAALRGSADAERQKFTLLLGVMGFSATVIDEIAIAYPQGDLMVADINLGMWNPESEGQDRVLAITGPGFDSYGVQYAWQRTEWGRYELMQILNGRSPIHAIVHGPMPFHASFKLPDLQAYAFACDQFLRTKGFEVVQQCVSKYGVFSYWQTPFSSVYLKPRVNLRDS